ncbi:ISL3 family transposase [Runella salmonicolor]|uniref:ISL3 family transposase n=1 Tax=Runella salmonicolor TaxID=2950278 RepID=A0ABT1FWT4_9BACT|nr:ISL3 family transposase [Runella salmonicolor]MCP1386235.1 ISL3 family transposase [Runella salmonicolor]
MDSPFLLPSNLDLELLNYELYPDRIDLQVISTASSTCCPVCGKLSHKIHSCYHRIIHDLPAGGRRVRLELQVRKYFCKNADCPRKIFTERFVAGLASYARRFDRLNQVLTGIGLESGGNSSTRQAHSFSVKLSASTVLRLIKKCNIPSITAPKIIGVDDWAFKKGRKYGTIIVDLEKHRVIDLLPDREAKTLSAWLLEHPSIEIVSRDRSNTYAAAITEACPQAEQIADRWHILKNLSETLERFLDTQRGEIKETALRLSQQQQKSANEQIIPDKAETLPQRAVFAGKYYDNFLKVKELQSKGYSIRKIAITLKMSRSTVAKYWNRIEFIPKTSHKRSNILDFETYLQQRWQQGQQSAKALYEEINDQGFTYSQATVYNAVRNYPKSVLEPLPESVKATYYSSKQLSIWLGMYQSDWQDYMPIEFLRKLLEENPLIKVVREIALEFRQLMKAKQGDQLRDWCNKALDSGVESLKGFVRGVKQDFKAIFQAFTSEWSNGQVEGQVNRLKNIKRQMYGRASFELLRKRVILMGIPDFHQM